MERVSIVKRQGRKSLFFCSLDHLCCALGKKPILAGEPNPVTGLKLSTYAQAQYRVGARHVVPLQMVVQRSICVSPELFCLNRDSKINSSSEQSVHPVRSAFNRLDLSETLPSAQPLASSPSVRSRAARLSIDKASPQIVVVGTSLGGLHALEVLLAGLPKNFPLPVAIAQHRRKDSDHSLSVFLQQQCALPLIEVEDKETVIPGRVYLAPADYHLLVDAGHFALSTEAPVSHARPSINVLFEAAADAYGDGVIGIILTGASDDGTQDLAKIKAYGGLAIVQEPTTAESPTMPKAAIASVNIDWILPLKDIAPLLVNLCHPTTR